MNKKTRQDKWYDDFNLAIKLVIVVAVMVTIGFWIDQSMVNRSNPAYTRLVHLEDEVIAANNALVIAAHGEDGEVNPIEAQKRADEKFEQMEAVAKVTPPQFIPTRVKEMIKYGPRRLVSKGETVDNSVRAGVQ